MGHRHESKEGQVYVGNLPPDVKTREVEDLFYKFGKINFINLKDKNNPPFAFIEFDDPRDAEDAIKERDGYNYDGYTLRVERPRGERGRAARGGFEGRQEGRMGRPSRGRGSFGPQRRSDHRILVSGLPSSGSWQDLKDHLREAGDIVYADTYGDGTGIAEFQRYEDMRYAVKKLDDTKFKSHEGETAYIRIKEDRKSRSPSRSRSRSDSRRRI